MGAGGGRKLQLPQRALGVDTTFAMCEVQLSSACLPSLNTAGIWQEGSRDPVIDRTLLRPDRAVSLQHRALPSEGSSRILGCRRRVPACGGPSQLSASRARREGGRGRGRRPSWLN